jgi:hypothetical protein
MGWLEEIPAYVLPRFNSPRPAANLGAFRSVPDGASNGHGRTDSGGVHCVELNSASAQQLQALPGIGAVLSARTVKFRQALGGFASVNQWRQVYGLDSTVFASLQSRVTVDASLVKPMCLESMTFALLRSHPNFDVASARRVLRAWGRGGVEEDVFWERLQPSPVERELWGPYLHICEVESDTSEVHR